MALLAGLPFGLQRLSKFQTNMWNYPLRFCFQKLEYAIITDDCADFFQTQDVIIIVSDYLMIYCFSNIICLIQCYNGPALGFVSDGRELSTKPHFYLCQGLEVK